MAPGVIANQVFIGCPWKNVRNRYERVLAKIKQKFPLSYRIIGRDDGQDAADLLARITEGLNTSSCAIFDATGGNANVSLEYGYSEAAAIPRALYLHKHKAVAHSKESPIISDLAGKVRNEYTNDKGLRKLLAKHAETHAFTRLYEKGLRTALRKRSKGQKKRMRSLTLKVIHALDNRPRERREDLTNELRAQEYTVTEIREAIRILRRSKILRSGKGPYAWLRFA